MRRIQAHDADDWEPQCQYHRACPGETVVIVDDAATGRWLHLCGYHGLEYLKRFDPEDPRKATPSYHGSTEHFDIERANAELVAPRFGTQAHRLLTWFYDNPDGETDWLLSVKLGMLHTSLGSVRNALTYGDKRTGRGGGWLEAVRDESGAVVQRPSGNGDGKGIVWAMTAPARSVWPRYAT